MKKINLFLMLSVCFCFGLFSCKKNTIVLESGAKYEMIAVPEKNFLIGKTEITQEVYEAVMKENPSFNKKKNYPAENLSFYDAIVFCNKLSELTGKNPCYSIDGLTDVSKWNYVPHQHAVIKEEIVFDETAGGYHIPTMEEWDFAIKGGQNFTYSGSNDLDSVAWTDCNAGGSSHQVATLKPNGYGIYDMSGNVLEWVWFIRDDSSRYCRGGSFFDRGSAGKCTNKELKYGSTQSKTVGMRIACKKS